ncbi:MAG: tRNA (N(6)-L-threonylcarbamoyladenosine(37)-C(2))-methylthiotransferase [Patescibacteria group bacterium]|nr:tRNA (N(6)-L-threonylcarbamoyladenosine(37)-C(2))-methylthiotransferase [Patescibacteria group bacterium]
MENYYIKTFGCKLNVADSFACEKVLKKFLLSSSEEEADLILVNSCGVIDKTERKVIKKIKEYKKQEKFVILTGCLPYISDKKLDKIADKVVKIRDFKKIKVILENITGKKECSGGVDDLKVPTSAIISIAEGCLGNCTYCGTKLARSVLKSKKQENVLKEVNYFLERGVKEIQITSQDLAVYGMDRGKQELPELLEKIISIDKFFRLRLGMTNPGHTKRILPELLKIYESKKIYNYIHIPVQSGDDKILKKMNRKHTVLDFIEICNSFYEKFSNFIIATDIIVGFPEEDEENFKKTYNLIKKTRPHIVNITRFSPRSRTKATEMKDMPQKIKKERSRKLNRLTKKIRIEQNKESKGKKHTVLISKKGKNNTLIARLPNYKALILKQGELGDYKKAKVTGYEHNYLKGKLL